VSVDSSTAAGPTGHTVAVMLPYYRQATETDWEATVAKSALAAVT